MSQTVKQYQKRFEWPEIGNDNLIEFLDRSLFQKKLAQTYIFAGPEDLGKSTMALAFARNLILSDRQEVRDFSSVNSDLHILNREPGKKNISIEAVRDFIKMLSLSSFLNSYKIGIIKGAETLSSEAASALLKTLEEPRDKVIIILLTSSVDLLMPTIVSRSQVLYFYPVAFDIIYDYLVKELNLKRGEAKNMAALAAGRPLLAVKFAENEADKTLQRIPNSKEIVELGLALLYMGEGFKKSSKTGMGNSDPLLLKFFLIILLNIYKVDIEKIRFELHIRADQNPELIKKYWAKKLEAPLHRFKSISIDKRTIGKNTYENYKGVCVIDCGNVAIQRKLVYIGKKFCERTIESLRG